MIKVIAFDLDGTLINAYPAVVESINFILKKFGLPPADGEVIKRTVGLGDRHLVQSFVGERHIDAAIPVYREYHAQALLRGSSCLPGARETLQTLRARGYRMVIASNRPKRFSMIVMEHLGIVHFFERVLCGDELERAKPYPDILCQLMRETDAAREEFLYVGDMDVDVQTARNAGVAMVGVLTGSCSREELCSNGADAILNDVTGLPGFLEEKRKFEPKLQGKAF